MKTNHANEKNMSKEENDSKLHHYFESLYELILSDPSKADEILITFGRDPYLVGQKGAEYIKKVEARIKIELATKRGLELLKKANEKLNSNENDFTEKDRTILARIMAGNDETLAHTYFNKLKSLGHNDILSMLNDSQLLEFIEEQDSENNFI